MATKREMLNEIKTLEAKAYENIARNWKLGETLTRKEIAELSGGFLTEANIKAHTQVTNFNYLGSKTRNTQGALMFDCTTRRKNIYFDYVYEVKREEFQGLDNPNKRIFITREISKLRRTR